MPVNPTGDEEWGDRWDQLYEVFSAEPRRMIIVSLTEVPPGRRVPLPDAAESPNQSMGPEMLSIHLRHHHLPKLAEAGYVRWERERFLVQRGPYFEEAAFVVEKFLESVDEIPRSLVDNCRVLQGTVDDE
jgi:hypothetical protein